MVIYDTIIIGSGPAGLSAGIYCARSRLKTLIFEGNQPGGQLMTTTTVENWPGDVSVQGPVLMERKRKQAVYYGAILQQSSVTHVDFSIRPFRIFSETDKKWLSKTVIIASGAQHKTLGCPGEGEYFAKGVSTCATCDAPFYRGKEVVVVGGGNTAMTEAEHLLHHVDKLVIVQNKSTITATDPIMFKVLSNPKVTFCYNATVKEIKGDGSHVTSVVVHHFDTQEVSVILASGVFLAVGLMPNTAVFKNQIEIDNDGYVKVVKHTQTSVPGVFVAGDVCDYRYRQAITASGAGCMAALDAQDFLTRFEME